MCFQLIIGIPLEFVHGSFRVGLLYCVGVVVGSMTSLVVTPETYLVGASGGDFCLVSGKILSRLFEFNSFSISFFDGNIVKYSFRLFSSYFGLFR